MDLYQELILEHSRTPHGAGLREPYVAEVHHVNTTCGDEVRLRVHLDVAADHERTVVTDLSYESIGCAISTASTSMMYDLVVGQPMADVERTSAAMQAMLTSRGTDPGEESVLGDGIALSGVARYPARVKCALLGWMALQDAVNRSDVTQTQEVAR